MIDYLLSDNWIKQPDEDPNAFDVRISLQIQKFNSDRKMHGNLFMVKFGDSDIRPMWEDKIDIVELGKQILAPSGVQLDCILCQPYDFYDHELNKYKDREYFCRIIEPKYPEGFIDKSGVHAKCICTRKGEDRKRNKFKNSRRLV